MEIKNINDFRKHINFRDLGGYESSDGRKVKPGLLYRSGGLYLLNREEMEYFLSLDIKCVIDFRTTMEIEARPDPELPGIECLQLSGLSLSLGETKEIDFSPIGMSKIGKEGHDQIRVLTWYYSELPFENQAYQRVMKKILRGETPLLFHCHTGKDRTGVFAMILLLALGIPEETVFYDFMLSNDYHREALDRAFMDNAEKIEKHPETKELLTMWFGVSERVGRTILSSIAGRYGSVQEYFKEEFNLTSDDLSRLRDRYLI